MKITPVCREAQHLSVAQPASSKCNLAGGVFILFFSSLNVGSVYAGEDNCKSVRISLQKQIIDEVPDLKRARVLYLNTIRQITASGPEGEILGYECWATVLTWAINSDVPKKKRIIYSVFNLNKPMGIDVEASMIGDFYVCGETKQLDGVHVACTQ